MRTLVIMRGLPASGKSTRARELVRNKGYKRLNRDDLRAMIDDGKWSKHYEKDIKTAELALAHFYLSINHGVIIDDTNLSPSTVEMWQNFAEANNASWTIEDLTDVPLDECIKRDQKRPNYVGEK